MLQRFTCKKVKNKSEFIRDKYAPRGYKSYCKRYQSIKVIRNKIKKLTTSKERTEYLIWLVVNGRTLADCSIYFQCSEDLLLKTLNNWGYGNNTKWCPQCKRFKKLENFANDKHNKRFGKKGWCINCRTET